MNRRRRNLRIINGSGVLVLALLLWISGFNPVSLVMGTPAQAATPNAATLARLDSRLWEMLPCKDYVPKSERDQNGDVQAKKPRDSFQAPVLAAYSSGPKRINHDVMSTAVSGSTDNAKLKNIAEKVCTEPYFGNSMAVALTSLKLGNDKTLGEVLGDNNGLLTAADQVCPLTAHELTNADDWDKYQNTASMVLTVLSEFNLVGVVDHPNTSRTYRFTTGYPNKDGCLEVTESKAKDALPTIFMALRNKGECRDASEEIGVNLNGPIPVVRAPQGCTKRHQTTPAHHGTTPPRSHHTTPPTQPTKPHSPPTTTKPPTGPTTAPPTTTPPTTPPTTTPPVTHPTTKPPTTPPTTHPTTHPPTTHPTTHPPTTHPTTHPPTTHPTTHPPTKPPKTCGPGYHGNYPDCHKDGTTNSHTPTAAPGTNPPDDPSHDPGSNPCYSDETGEPIPCV